MITIQAYLTKHGYSTVSDETYSFLDEWLEWYQGYVKSFHNFSVYNGIELVSKDKYMLGMAKTIAEDWANLLLNEKVMISSGTDFDKQLEEV